ncbi:MAG: tetratricopeptide repeat protein, partial [Amylibacter sp.]
ANEMLEQGAAQDAAETFAAILGEDPENANAYAGHIKAHLALGDTEKVAVLLQATPDAISQDPLILAVKAQIELADMTEDAGEVGDLKSKLAANLDDHQARFDLAMAELANDDPESAVNTLLDLFGRDREWNDMAAKTQLFKIFDALGAQDPITKVGRRKLSSMIFA